MRPDINSANKEVAGRLLHLSNLVDRYYGSVCDRFGVSLSGLSVITTLSRSAPRELTLAELNQDVLVTSGGITFVVAQLERHGLVAKRSNPADGRAVLVKLTRKGRHVAGQLISEIARADSAALGALDRSDLSAINSLLKTMESRLDAAMTEHAETAPQRMPPASSFRASRR